MDIKQYMLVLSREINGAGPEGVVSPSKPTIVRFEGNYADVWPLFKLRKIPNAPVWFSKASDFRAKYATQVGEVIKPDKPIISVVKPKQIKYHVLLIKMLLADLDLLELEAPIAEAFGQRELPMLEKYQFNFWDIRLIIYNKNMTPRPAKLIRMYQRRADHWFNLTAAAVEHDGDEAAPKKIIDYARDNQMLFHRLEAAKSGDNDTAKKLTAAEKRAVADKYVDTTWSRGVTWCHPQVFDETMRALFWDWRLKCFNPMMDAGTVIGRREILRDSEFTSVKYFSSEQAVPPGDESGED